ncbi:hypothetical protein NP569_27780, partial [Vibrio parahaemolyticus]|nr:hypothetical protein [Vibrio parahaemolyticus]
IVITDLYGTKHEYSSFITVSDFKYWLDNDSGFTGDLVTYDVKHVYKVVGELGAKLSVIVDGVLHSFDIDNNG